MENLSFTGCPEWIDDDGTPCGLPAERVYTIPADGNCHEMTMVQCSSGVHKGLMPSSKLDQFIPTQEQEVRMPAQEIL